MHREKQTHRDRHTHIDTDIHVLPAGHITTLARQDISREGTVMFQLDIAPGDADIPNISAQDFFSRVPDGCFNLLCSYMTDLEDYKSLHVVIHKNKQCKVHWQTNLHKYAHRSEPLFDVFTSKPLLRWTLFEMHINARDWELHLTEPYGPGGATKTLTHNESFASVCREGDLDIVRAMVERTQVDLEARDAAQYGGTPLHCAAQMGHLPVVQYLCEQGVDKEAKNGVGHTPLYSAAIAAIWGGNSVVHYLCEQGAAK